MADQYDPRNVAVIVNGQEIVGFAEGTFIEAERSTERWSADVGAKGEVTFVRSADDTGTVTITLKHNSPSNSHLYELFQQQDEQGAAPITISIQDRNFDGDVSVSGSECKIVNPPTFSRGDEIEDAEWQFLVADYQAVFDANQ